ncbi:MAG: 4Fe-4S dicluster domain-containing protein [Desulfovibrio sp.]
MSTKAMQHIEVCRGIDPGQCPHRIAASAEFAERLERVVRESGWPAFLEVRHGARLHFHHAFRLAISGCPNGCSRPHIQDLGLIRAERPALDPVACSSCGLCAESCPDGAMTMRAMAGTNGDEAELPAIDPERCLRCGHCVRVCPTGALRAAEQGWRIVAGGRLGRRPTLGRELPGLFNDEQALAILDRALRLYMERGQKGQRFGALLDEVGIGALMSEGVAEGAGQ